MSSLYEVDREKERESDNRGRERVICTEGEREIERERGGSDIRETVIYTRGREKERQRV